MSGLALSYSIRCTVAYAAVTLGSQTMTKCHLIDDSTGQDKEVSKHKEIARFSQCSFFYMQNQNVIVTSEINKKAWYVLIFKAFSKDLF